MRRFILLLLIIYSHIAVYGDALSQYKDLFDKSKKEFDNQNYVKSLEYLLEAKSIAETNNWLNMRMHALNNMALVYTEIPDYEKAMECYLEAYQITIKEPSKEEEICILNNISHLYSINKDFDKAKEYVRKAYEGAIQLQDSLRAGRYATNLGSFANQTGDLEQAEKYLNIAMIMLKDQTGDSSLLLITKLVKVENLYLKKEYQMAEKLALVVLEQTSEIQDNDLKIECLLRLSKIYQQKKEFQKAIKAAKEALTSNPKLPATIEIYQQLSDLYRDIDVPYLALQYQDSVMTKRDSLIEIKDRAQLMNNQIKFDLINSEKELAENKAKQKTERLLFIFIIAFIIVFVLILIWVFRIQSTKNKQMKIITGLELEKEKNEKLLLEQQLKEQETLTLLSQEQLNNEKLLLKQQLHEQEVLSLLEQERLNDEIDAKNRQLTSKILFQSSRNELIEEIIHNLTEIPNQSENPVLRSVIRKLKAQIKESTDWNSFLTYFEQINPSFLSSLKAKHPDLTANEIRLLSYMYLNLDTKEISKLLNITPNYCRKKRQRLSKKMKIPTSSMYNYLINIV